MSYDVENANKVSINILTFINIFKNLYKFSYLTKVYKLLEPMLEFHKCLIADAILITI